MELVDLTTQQARIRDSLETRIQAVLSHGRYVMGPEVEELEARLAERAGMPHAIGVSSGTDALLIALMALGIRGGDEVITTAFTFVATAEAIALLGAKPVFVDIEADTYNLDAALLERAITPATRAVIAVDVFGQCAGYRELETITAKHGLALVEDAAQSFGASYHDRPACSFGQIACTSFFPSKPLGCYGDGGACFTADERLAASIRELRNHGQSGPYHYARVGINGRLDTLQAAVLLAKLEIFDHELRRRSEVAANYDRLLPDPVSKPVVRSGRRSAWAQYTIEIDDRDRIRDGLASRGIPAAVHYPKPLHHHPPYHAANPLPVTEAASRRVLSLPLHPYLEEQDQRQIATALGELLT